MEREIIAVYSDSLKLSVPSDKCVRLNIFKFKHSTKKKKVLTLSTLEVCQALSGCLTGQMDVRFE